MGGLKQGTEDYEYVFNKFWEEAQGYDIDNYDADAIYKDPERPHFKRNYDAKQFKGSIKRLVDRIRERREVEAPRVAEPPFVAATTAPPAPSASPVAPSPMASPPAAARAPMSPATPLGGIPPKEYVANNELTLCLPHHLIEWKDCDDNRRLTLLVYMPTGCHKDDIAPRIVGGGTEVVVEYKWPVALLEQKLPMFAGTVDGNPFYEAGHVKVASFRDNVRRIKQNDENAVVKSIFRCDLPTTVEEQFTSFDVPAAVATVKYTIASARRQEAICLVLEMMALRTNYKAAGDIDDFELDFSTLMI